MHQDRLLTILIILKVVASVAVRLGCSQRPQPGEVGDHGVRGTVHNAYETGGAHTEDKVTPAASALFIR